MASAAARVALVKRGMYMRGRATSKLILLRKHLMASRDVLLAGLCCLGAKRISFDAIYYRTLPKANKFNIFEVVVRGVSGATEGPFIEEKSVESPEISPRSSGVGCFQVR
jgi:hypothetical protein